jgi:hypothetical protein
MEPQARMRRHAWGLETASGSGDYVAASALTEVYAVGRLYHDRRLTLRGAGRPDGAPVLRILIDTVSDKITSQRTACHPPGRFASRSDRCSARSG